jgi:hypothetical protein
MILENLTLSEVLVILSGIITFINVINTLRDHSKKAQDKILEPNTEKIDDLGKKLDDTCKKIDEKIDGLEVTFTEKIDKIEYESCKTFLVSTIAEIKRMNELGQEVDGVLKKRFFERYDRYIALGGNTYVKSEVENLKKNGII